MDARALVGVVVLALVFSVPAQAGSLLGSFVQVADDITTNPLIYDGPFDVWHFVLESDVDVAKLEVSFLGQGEFINTTNADFLDRGDLVNGVPQVLGMDAPGTAFLIPSGASVIDENTLNDPFNLGSSFMVDLGVLDVPLVPGNGTTTPVTAFSVAGDSPLAFDASLVDQTSFFRAFDRDGNVIGDDPLLPPDGFDAEIHANVHDVVMHQFEAADIDGGLGPEPWSNLIVELGNPLITPTLDPDGKLTWDTSGSPFGSLADPLIYKFTATVTDRDGLSDTATLTINLIPEPAALALMGLAMLGLGVIRRR